MRLLLSRLKLYYFAKLLVVAYLLLFDGAAHLFHRLRTMRYKLTHSRLWRRQRNATREGGTSASSSHNNKDFFIIDDGSEPLLLEDDNKALADLEAQARFAALSEVAALARTRGIPEAYRQCLRGTLGAGPKKALLEYLETKDLAFLYLRLRSARVILPEALCNDKKDKDDKDDEPRPNVEEASSSSDKEKNSFAAPSSPASQQSSNGVPLETMEPVSPTRPFFDKKHGRQARDVSVASSFYCVLHLVPSPEGQGDGAKRAATFFLKKKEVESMPATTGGFSSLFLARAQRAYVRWRKTEVAEILLGFFEDEALVSVRSRTARGGSALAPQWLNEDLELKLVGGTVDPKDGTWRNDCCSYMSLLLQLWVAEPLRPDNLLGETTLCLADFMHGLPVSLNDLPLFSTGLDQTAVADITIKLSPM